MSQDAGRLAMHGGARACDPPLPYSRQTIDETDIAAVVDVLRSDWITTGPKVEEFEAAFADSVGARYAVSFSSGTAALHAAVFAAGLGPGDEAITTPLTFCATANCLLYQGATPRFADVRPDRLTLDPDRVAAAITPRTRAILPVDYAGHPANLAEFAALAERHGLVVIEDAAHALGARASGARVGSLSHMTAFSFHPAKQLTTGEGGAVTTSDPALAKRLRLFRNHGIETTARERQAADTWTWQYEMTALGYNYRLTDIACALGLSQLNRLPASIERRRAIAARYSRELAGLPLLELPGTDADVESAWHLYPVRVRAPLSRDEVGHAMRMEGLGVVVHYPPVHLHRYYRDRFGFSGGEFANAELASRELISLPLFPAMTADDVDNVITAVRKVLMHFAREVPA
jgi:perosamine synthetase